jgi:hypothetical protein
MIVYNVTTKVDWSIADNWVQWMKEEHIPGILATGCFISSGFYKLLQVDDVEGETYTVQYFADNLAGYETYIKQYATAFRQEVMDKFGEKLIAFRSLMEQVE